MMAFDEREALRAKTLPLGERWGDAIRRNLPDACVYYVCVFLIYLVLGRVSLYSLDPTLNLLATYLFAGVGFLLVLCDLIWLRSIKRVPGYWLLLLFLVLMTVSSIVNLRYGWIDNVKTIVWTAIQFLIIVPAAFSANRKWLVGGFKLTYKIVFVLYFIAASVSLIQALLQVGYVGSFQGIGLKRQGFIDGRLFGVFFDPNHAASDCAIVAMVALYCLKERVYSDRWNAILKIGIAVFSAYAVLSGSRALLVALGVLTLLFAVIAVGKRKSPFYGGLLSAVKKAAIAWWVFWLVLSLLFPCYARFVDFFTVDAEKLAGETYVRQDVGVENISNNRFAIWEDYLEVSADSLLIGKSPRNYLKSIEIEHADLYIASRSETYEPHNGYLAVLVALGFPGVLVMACMAALVIRGAWLCFKKDRAPIDSALCLVFAAFVLLAIKSFFFTMPFFSYQMDSALFWLGYGYLLKRFYGARELKERV